MIVRGLNFDVTPKEGVEIQRRLAVTLAGHRSTKVRLKKGDLVAGADAAYHKPDSLVFGAVVVCRYPEMEPVEVVTRTRTSSFPYVPGLLSFREAPVLLDCFSAVRSPIRAVIVDGAGSAHPRGFGLACHVGYALEAPTVGCAKSLLFGSAGSPRKAKGSLAPIRQSRRKIGQVVRTRTGVSPVYVSIGWDLGLASAVRLVLQTVTRYRLPEPTRLADMEVGRFKREVLSQ